MDKLYVHAELPNGIELLIYILGLLFFGVMTYMAAYYHFKDDYKNKRLHELRDLIRFEKKYIKNNSFIRTLK